MTTTPKEKSSTNSLMRWVEVARQALVGAIPAREPITDGPTGGLRPWFDFKAYELETGVDVAFDDRIERIRESVVILARAAGLNPQDEARMMELLGLRHASDR